MTPTGRGALRVVLGMLGVGFGLAVAAAWVARVPEQEHKRYVMALRRVAHLDAQLNAQVAASHMGLVDHYDDLVRTGDAMAATRAQLARPPVYVPDHHRDALADALASLDRSLDEKAELVERFKTDRAVVRNASRAFPAGISRLIQALVSSGRAEAADRVQLALVPALVVAVDPSDARLDQAACALARLPPAPPSLPGGCGADASLDLSGDPRAAELAGGVRHVGEVLLDRQRQMEDTTRALMTMPVATATMALASVYDRAHAEAVDRFDVRFAVVNLLVVGLIGCGALMVVMRLVADAAELRATTGRLHVAMSALQVERDRDAELARLKNRFVAMTSHEFRTPLSVILSSAELLDAYGAGWSQDRRQKHHDRIMNAGRALSRLIDRILVIGRADAAMLDVEPRLIQVQTLLDDVLAEVQAGLAVPREIELRGEVPQGPRSLDPKLLHHVLANLLTNALKYSPDDTAVSLEIQPSAGGVAFVVCDAGIGIPEDELDQLFEPFHRCENVGDVAGTGLGLAIVARAVDALGGTLSVETRLGQGSCFTATVPFLENAT